MKLATRSDLVVFPRSRTPSERSLEKRRLRKHRVLNVVREHGPLSRADIAKISGFNLPSVSSLVDELVADGLALEDEAREIPRGRRPIPVYLNRAAAGVVGIDAGKRNTVALMTNLAGEVLARIEHPTPPQADARALAEWVCSIIEQISVASGNSAPPLCGVGVGIPGVIVKDAGPGNGAEYPAIKVRQAIEQRFGVGAIVENDTRMMAIGSRWYDVGREFSTYAVINLGHGTGAGLVIEGRVYGGKHGFAGELGYVPVGERGVQAEGFEGRPDCMENTGSAAGLLRMAQRDGLAVQSAVEVLELARDGNRTALAAVDAFADSLGRGIATLVNLLDPEAIILGGRLSRYHELFLPRLEQSVRTHSLPTILAATRILVSRHEADLAPMGAAAAVLDHIFHARHIDVDVVI